MTKVDGIDKKILQELARDARQPIERLAAAVNLSPTPVRRRIKRMEDERLIRRYSVDVDMRKAGYTLTLVIFVKLQSRNHANIAEFEARVQALPQISRCVLITGAQDYILTMSVQDMDDYNSFLRSALAELPGVAGIESNVVITEVKETVPLPL